MAEWRLVQDAGQIDEDDAHWSKGFKLAFKDYRLYIFTWIFLCIQVASATSNFFPSVVGTLGFNRVNTLLLTVPPYMVALFTSIFNNWSADRFKNSSFHAMWPLTLAIIGFVVAAASLNTGARYFAMVLMIAGGHGSNAVVLAWTQKTMLRPRIKRASAVAFVNAFGNTSQVWTAYLYADDTAPRYALAMSVNAAMALGAIVGVGVMRIILQKANQKLGAGGDVGDVMKGEARAEIAGVSEEERLARKQEFRYIA